MDGSACPGQVDFGQGKPPKDDALPVDRCLQRMVRITETWTPVRGDISASIEPQPHSPVQRRPYRMGRIIVQQGVV
jgi:hypothetical protein